MMTPHTTPTKTSPTPPTTAARTYACADCRLTFPNQTLRRSHCNRLIHSPAHAIISPLSGARLAKQKALAAERSLCNKLRKVSISKSGASNFSEQKTKKLWPCFCNAKLTTLKAGIDHLKVEHHLAIGDELPAEALYVPVRRQLSCAYYTQKAKQERAFKEMVDRMAKVWLGTPVSKAAAMPKRTPRQPPKNADGFEIYTDNNDDDMEYSHTTRIEEANDMEIDDWCTYDFQPERWQIPELR